MATFRRSPHILAVLERLARLVEAHGPKLRVAEIGVYRADLTLQILDWFDECFVWGIDPWEPYDASGEYFAPDMRFDARRWEQVYRRARQRVESYGGRCELLRVSSDAAAVALRDGGLHLIVIDGLHTFEQVVKDVENYYPLLAPHGVMGGHDLTYRSPGVAKALETVGRPYTAGIDGTWWYEPKAPE